MDMTERMEEMVSVLVVDDDPAIRLACARLMRSAGYPVMEAATGGECLAAVRESLPDLVLLDMILPDIDGCEVCRRIKTDPALRGTYVVILSGKKILSDDQSEGLEIGADGYIARPLSNRELLARVHAISRIIRAERERDRLIGRLQKALAEIRTLSALLPMCASCKKIRNDTGGWEPVDSYITRRTDTLFTHGICPECEKMLYGEFAEDEPEVKNGPQ